MVKEVDHPTCGKIKVTGVPVKLSQYARCSRTPAAYLGPAHRRDSHQSFGYSKGEVEKLRKEKVI